MLSSYSDAATWWLEEGARAKDGPSMMERVTATHEAYVRSGVRHMKECTELSGKAHLLALRAMRLTAATGDEAAKKADKAELGKVVDELRETYRQMAELPMKEYGALQSELIHIWQTEAGRDEPKRRAKAKT